MVVQLGRRGLAATLAFSLLASSGLIHAHRWSVHELRQYHCLRTGLPMSQKLQVRRRAWAQQDAAGTAGSVVGRSAAPPVASLSDAPCEAYWHLQGRLVNVYTGAEMSRVEGVETIRNVGFWTSGDGGDLRLDSSDGRSSSGSSVSSTTQSDSSKSSRRSSSNSNIVPAHNAVTKTHRYSSDWWAPVLAAHLAKEETSSHQGRRQRKLPEGEEIVAHSAFVTSKIYTFHDLAPAAARAATPPQSWRAWCTLPFRSGFLPSAVNPPPGDKACVRRLVVHTLHRDGTLHVASLPAPLPSHHLWGAPSRPHTVVEGGPGSNTAGGERGSGRDGRGGVGGVEGALEKLPRWLALLNNPFGGGEEEAKSASSSPSPSSSSQLDSSLSSVFSGPGERREAESPLSASSLSSSSSKSSPTPNAIKLSFFVGTATKAKTLRQSLVQFGPAPTTQPACREEYTFTPGRDSPPPPPRSRIVPMIASSSSESKSSSSGRNPFGTTTLENLICSAQHMWPPSWPGRACAPPSVTYRRLGPCPAWSPASQGSSGGLCALELTGRRYRHPRDLLRALGPGMRQQPDQQLSAGSLDDHRGQSVAKNYNGFGIEGPWPLPPPVRPGDGAPL